MRIASFCDVLHETKKSHKLSSVQNGLETIFKSQKLQVNVSLNCFYWICLNIYVDELLW